MTALPKIKRNILSILLRSKEWLRYSDIYDHDEENDLFNYHLQHLVEKGLVDKKDKLYHISSEGIIFSLNDGAISAQNYFIDKMKVNVLNLVIKKENGKLSILNQTRKRYPFYGNSGISGGVVLKGEKLLDAASRNLKIKTGLDGKFSKVIGTIRGTFYLKDVIFQDIFLFVCLCTDFKGELVRDNELSVNTWHTIEESIKIEEKTHFGWQSLLDLYEELKTKSPEKIDFFIKEETTRVTSLY